ncbi:hypothetical protein AVEN_266677-1 [Araneus ventricosus]|uniref:Uncharacterized protein n=1 Tax=Araneus ventricosus TaxID=182803 RepID=A0A4Y2RG39_ARAVE|nr:hypothetical protein AVEN_266677-1 [Araneus ventricosus]
MNDGQVDFPITAHSESIHLAKALLRASDWSNLLVSLSKLSSPIQSLPLIKLSLPDLSLIRQYYRVRAPPLPPLLAKCEPSFLQPMDGVSF